MEAHNNEMLERLRRNGGYDKEEEEVEQQEEEPIDNAVNMQVCMAGGKESLLLKFLFLISIFFVMSVV